MRRAFVCAQMTALLLLFAACGGGAGKADQTALDLRARYIAAERCDATVRINADYGERVYDYTVDYTYEKEGESILVITAPAEVAGVTARLSGGATSVEFDGARLETGPLSPSGLSPVDALPALMRYAASGCIAECALERLEEGGPQLLHVSYREANGIPGQGAEASVWFEAEAGTMVRGEILDGGRRIILCEFDAFALQ